MGNSKSSKTMDLGKTPKNDQHSKPVTMSTLVDKNNAHSSQIEPNESNAAAKVAASKMPIDLYYVPPSAPCRAVLLGAKVIGLDLNLKICNIMEGDNMKQEFLKLNPLHTIPVMDDNGFVIIESRAILAYMANQYGKDDTLYPKDPQSRALVDQRMLFDIGTLYQRVIDYYLSFIFHGTVQTPENLKKLQEAVGWLNTFLDGQKFVAGNHLTIADITLVVTISNIDVFGFDLKSYPNVSAWYARTKDALAPHGYEEINQAGANIIAGFYKNKKESS